MGLFNSRKKPKELPSSELRRDGWNFYSYAYGQNLRALIEFDTQIAKEEKHEGYDYCVRVIIHSRPKNCNNNGLPTPNELLCVNYVEHDLLSNLNSLDYKYTGKMSYGGMRDLNFQTNQPSEFLAKANKWASTQKTHKIQMLESDGWDFYEKKVKPDHGFWQQISDRATIGSLIEHGSNPEKEHEIEHLFIGDRKDLEFLRDQLLKDGFTLIALNDDKLTLMKPAKLVGSDLSGLTEKLARYTAQIGVAYDGWGAMIVK